MNNNLTKELFLIPDRNLVQKYSERKSSFYSYYPMNGLWSEGMGFKNYPNAIDEIHNSNPRKPINLYIHFPFCETQCLFCHCFTIISKSTKDHDKVVDFIIKEIEILEKLFDRKGFKPNIKEIHFGGGSPSNLSKQNFSRLIASIKKLSLTENFEECALEIDPRYNIDEDKLNFFANVGINRISFGIQDFDSSIGKIVNRINSEAMINNLLTNKMRKRFKGINFDLIYGMPNQTLKSWLITVDKAINLSPDRLAVYVWGFRPDLYPHMKALEKYDRAGPQLQLEMFIGAVNKFKKQGYEFIGIDHMAKPSDVLSKAKLKGTLDRNAIGYTPGIAKDIIAVGPNSMSTIGNYYFQNFHVMKNYYSSISKKILPIVRGYHACTDDLIRREVIFKIILNSEVVFSEIEKNNNFSNFKQYFKYELNLLKELENDGIIILGNNNIKLTRIGRFFQRHVCQIFDKFDREIGYRYSREFDDGKAAFNRTAQLKA